MVNMVREEQSITHAVIVVGRMKALTSVATSYTHHPRLSTLCTDQNIEPLRW